MTKLAIITPLLRDGSERRYLFRVHLVDGERLETRHYRGENGGWGAGRIRLTSHLPHDARLEWMQPLSITGTEWKALLAQIRSEEASQKGAA